MLDRNPWLNRFTHLVLCLGIAALCFPIYYALVAATLPLEEVSRVPMPLVPGDQLFVNLGDAWVRGDLGRQMFNSFVMAGIITVGKIVISMLSAFAIIYFRFPFRQGFFWMIFITLMLPVEVRIVPTFQVAANLNLLNSYLGLSLPLIASATATFLFRQFFMTVPDEFCEAARIDGATPMQFFWKILLPVSRTNIAALVVILFVFGWNQYLWPLLITTEADMTTAVIGVRRLIPSPDAPPEWNIAMAGALLIVLPPILVVITMQRFFVKGLVETEK